MVDSFTLQNEDFLLVSFVERNQLRNQSNATQLAGSIVAMLSLGSLSIAFGQITGKPSIEKLPLGYLMIFV